MPENEYLTEREFSKRYHVSVRTVQRWRVTGEGPRFVRLGPRRVVYRLSDCEFWAASRTHASRAEEAAIKPKTPKLRDVSRISAIGRAR